MFGQIGIAPGKAGVLIFIEDEVAASTVLVGHEFAEPMGRRVTSHERSREYFERTIVAGPEVDRACDCGRDRQYHAVGHSLVPNQGVVDQETVNPAISVAHGMDVHEAKCQHCGTCH
ncbi:hypothetical protein D9M73_218750 [compost metagenome]